MKITRRHGLTITAAAMPAALLAACGTVTSKTMAGVTTVTINVAKVDAYAQAFENAGNTILSVPGVTGLLGPYAIVASDVTAIVGTDIAAFDKAAGGKTVLTFDATSVPASVNSVLADGQKLLTTFRAGLPQTAVVGALAAYLNALATVVSLFEAMIGAPPASATKDFTPMPEGVALAILGVQP